jgi:hypothetical protein
MRNKTLLVTLVLLSTVAAWADAQSDAEKLKNEALDILKANSNRQASDAQYASCIFKLEQAQAILDKAKDDNSPLAQEVSSSLFWARRFSNVPILKELDKLRAGAPMPPPPPVAKKTEPAKPAVKKPDEEDEAEPPAVLAEAKKAYSAAESFAQSHANDDYAVALRWFQVANEHPGTDYAMKALELARQAQVRFSAKSVPEEALPDTPEMKFVKDADAMAKSGKMEEAIALYQTSIKTKDNPVAHRKLGHFYYQRAQALKDELLPKFEENEAAWRKARKEAFVMVKTMSGMRRKFNPSYPPLVEANKKQLDLVKQANVSIANYDKAFEEFRAVLKLAANGKDLDAAGHQALCLTVKGDANARQRGRQLINQVLADYTPANDVERNIYEFCKTELARINKG